MLKLTHFLTVFPKVVLDNALPVNELVVDHTYKLLRSLMVII